MKPRCVYQIDGQNGGIVSVAERKNENCVLLIISNGESETQISLSKEDFNELASLQYNLRFTEPQAEQSALRVVG
ncbi:hypothetical protein [Crenothrix polyspora]|uniref:Uncharacterized protein n=1 Tax=Crenothrix polyspora TaxID=360316 RepID=A0A1R4HIX5_9GAMM|nr:hypothetical protein [Crenothrix polyspora]SJM95961.1 conserved hypothetical protein [Crenothrix polyspora]